jgi:hypothetical protein
MLIGITYYRGRNAPRKSAEPIKSIFVLFVSSNSMPALRSRFMRMALALGAGVEKFN